MISQRDRIRLLILMALGVLGVFLSLATGAVQIPLHDVFSVLLGGKTAEPAWSILVEERFFRTLNAFVAGGALAVVGVVLQSYFRNPLAGPGVLGISSGASLGVAVAVLLPWSFAAGYLVQVLFGLIGSFTIIVFLIFVNRWSKGVTLLVIGLMIGYFTSAFVSTLLNSSTDAMMRRYVEWGFGSFGLIHQDIFWYYFSFLLLLLAFVQIIFPKILNVWVLGEQMLVESGYNTKRVRLLILFFLGLIIAVVTVSCGPIAFLGIAVPQISRMLLKSTNHSILIPTSFFVGACLAVLADILVRTLQIPIPLNGILALFGAPIIVYVIVKGSRKAAI